MSLESRLERLERAGLAEPGAARERITVDAGDGYRIDVDVPAGTLVQLAKAYSDEPTIESREGGS